MVIVSAMYCTTMLYLELNTGHWSIVVCLHSPSGMHNYHKIIKKNMGQSFIISRNMTDSLTCIRPSDLEWKANQPLYPIKS